MTSAKLNLSHGVFTAICLVALVGCSWIPPEDPLFRKLIVLAQDNHDRHDLLSSGETLDLEATVNSLIQEGFSPDFAELPFATYQKCGPFVVPIIGTDKRFQSYDQALLNRFSDLLHWDSYRITLSVEANCRIVRVEGSKLRPVTL